MSNVTGLGTRMRFTSLPDRPQRLLKAYRHLVPLYVELARRSGPRAFVQVRQSVIAESLGMDVRTVRRHTAELKSLGLIEVRRTRRTAFTWLPDHSAYARDWEAYRERAEANRLAGYPQHMDRTGAHMDRTPNPVRQDTDVLSRQDTNVLSIDLEVSSIEVPSSRRPEGQAASDDGTFGNHRSDGLTALAPSYKPKRRYDVYDPTRPDEAEDTDVHEDCQWTFGHPRHIRECVEARTA